MEYLDDVDWSGKRGHTGSWFERFAAVTDIGSRYASAAGDRDVPPSRVWKPIRTPADLPNEQSGRGRGGFVTAFPDGRASGMIASCRGRRILLPREIWFSTL